MMKTLALAVLAVVAVQQPRPLAALDKLALQVSPAVVMAQAHVTVRAIVEHDASNRALEIVADSDNFYRRSVVSLEGELAPKISELKLKDLPGGEYHITVTLYDDHRVRARAHKTLLVVSSGVDR